MFQTTITKNDIVRIYEPPVDISVNADIIIEVKYDVGNQETYNLMGNSVPENAVADTASLGVLKGLNSAFPSGLSFKQIQNPPAEIGNAALEIVKDNLLKFFGIVFTSIVVREIKAEVPSFVAAMIPGYKSVAANTVITRPDNQWICPNCANKNTGSFCMECGTKKPVTESWICPNCQTSNKMKFCSECGTKKH